MYNLCIYRTALSISSTQPTNHGHFLITENNSSQWHHNGRDGVSNHQTHHCLPNLYSGADQRKQQSSASLAFVQGIHWSPVNTLHKWPVTRKMFPFDAIIMWTSIQIKAWINHIKQWDVITHTCYDFMVMLGQGWVHSTWNNGCNLFSMP